MLQNQPGQFDLVYGEYVEPKNYQGKPARKEPKPWKTKRRDFDSRQITLPGMEFISEGGSHA